MCLESRTSELEDASLSSRKLARLRIDSLNEDDQGSGSSSNSDGGCDGGLANELISILQGALLLYSTNDLSLLLRVLKILENVTITDDTLSEEVDTSKGFRDCLQKIILLQQRGEIDDILLKSIRGLATTIETSLSKLETADKADPFTNSQLQSRLPLIFGISQNHEQSDLEIMIHQVTSEEETETHDTGYVMWPSSVILARWITEHPSLILDHVGDDNGDVLELGAGCGLVGLTAAALLQQRNEKHRIKCEESKEEVIHDSYNNASVIFTDYLPAVLENIERNICLNDFNKNCSTKVAGLDFFDQPGNDDSEYDDSQPNWIDMTGAKQSQVSLVLAADVLAYSNDAQNVANTIHAALVEGGKAIVVSADENKRYGVAEFPEACRNAGLEITLVRGNCSNNVGDSGEDINIEELFVRHNLEQTIGYHQEGYNFIIFTIEKPLTSSLK